jgi:hypothetical protein
VRLGVYKAFYTHAYLPLKVESKIKEETGDQWAKGYIERPMKTGPGPSLKSKPYP